MLQDRQREKLCSHRLHLRQVTVHVLIATMVLLISCPQIAAQTGTAIWRSNTSTIPLQSVWDGSSFSASTGTADVGDYRTMAGAEAPTRDEKIIVGVTESNDISGLIYSSGSWSAFPFNDMSSVSESIWWGFDVAYEQLSGDALLVWNNGNTGTEGISYRVWNGSVWSDEDSTTLPLSGEPMQMRLAANPLSDEMVLIVSNSSSQDYAIVWDGSAWGNSEVLSPSGASNERTDVYVSYERASGHALLVYSQGAAALVRYSVWDGSDWSSGSAAAPGGVTGYARWTTLASDPNSDRIALSVLTDNEEVWLNVWDGASWGLSDTATTATTGKTYPNMAIAFEGLSGNAIAVYGEDNAVKTRTWVNGVGWSAEGTAVDIGDEPNSMMLDACPNSDQIMLSVQDDAEDLGFVFWDGDSWGSRNELETETTEIKNQPFVFLWDIEALSNQAPVLAAIGAKSVEEGQNLNFDITASDPDGTTPSLTAEDIPVNASFVDNGDGTGTFDFDPNFDQADTYDVLFIASDGALADSEEVAVTVTPDPLQYIVVTPDSATVSADSTCQFVVTGYDGGDNEIDPGIITWGLTNPVGTIDVSGLFDATTVGQARVTVTSSLGPADSSAFLDVIPGVLSVLSVSPDSIQLSVGASTMFAAEGFDEDSNAASLGDLIWEVIGDIGEINSFGAFTALAPGSGRIAVASSIGNVSDTNSAVIVVPSTLSLLVVSPDTASMKLNTSLAFEAIGFDSQYDPSDVGTLTWEVIGGIGTIDSNGVLTVTSKGSGWIVATSSVNNISDTTNMVVVEVPTVSEIPLGNAFVYPDQALSCVLAFKITNAFDISTAIDGITLQIDSRGAGNSSQLLSNIDSVELYSDANGDLLLDESDLFIAGSEALTSTIALTFSPVSLGPGAELVLFASVNTSLYPHDTDSLDILLLPASGIQTTDGSPVAGPDTINSLGYNVIDGLVADQLTRVLLGNGIASPSEKSVHLLTLDIPRNGYREDMLNILSVFNAGTATEEDVDSLFLYKDNGNGVWGGSDEESLIGELAFTGGLWSISGLSQPLAAQTNRFHVAATISDHPTNGATIAVGIPVKGLEMSSGNDGPIDKAVEAVDTVLIRSSELLSVRTVQVLSRGIVPGENTGPLVGIEFVNTYTTDVVIDSILCTTFAVDPDGATQSQLDSQFDDLSIWRNLDDDYSTTGPADILIASGSVSDGQVLFPTGGLVVAADGGVVGLFLEADLDAVSSKNGNSMAPGVLESAHIYTSEAAVVSGSFPIKNSDEFLINAFSSSAIKINTVESKTLFSGQIEEVVLDFELPRDGYADAYLGYLELINVGSSDESAVLDNVQLWSDSDKNGIFSASDDLIDRFGYINGTWRISDIMFLLDDELNRMFVTVDVRVGNFTGGTLQFEIPTGGVRYVSGTAGPDDSPVGNPEAHLLFTSDRITLISIPMETYTAAPGSEGNTVFSFALYNGYTGQEQTLEAVRISNISRSRSSVSFSDSELGQLLLYYDENKDRVLDDDLLIASGYFSGGNLNLTGLDIVLMPESISHFFAVFDLPLDVIDSDSLQIGISEQSDIVFDDAVNINGDLPLSTGGYVVADGSVRDQYGLLPVTPRTLSPGDADVLLFAFHPAPNGDQMDTLISISIANLGDADANDISSLELWMDTETDGVWSIDDSLLGQFTYTGEDWIINSLSVDVESGCEALFVLGDVSISAASDVTIQPSIPLDGCQYSSANDGPRDFPLIADQIFVISRSGLRLTYTPLNSAYTTGQEIRIDASVTNLLSEEISDIYMEALLSGDGDAVSFVEAFDGPVSLLPGETAEFYRVYSADRSGTVTWQLRAFSASTSETSAVVSTESVTIQETPSLVAVEIVSSIPTAVALGQSYVFPMSVRYGHSDTASVLTPIRLDSLRLRIEDGSGAPQPADIVFSRIVLATGYTNLSILESMPSESSVLLVFDSPTVAEAGDIELLSLRVDIDSLAEANDFSISIEDASSISVVDNNTSLIIPIDPSVEFPLTTDVCRIDYPSENLAVSYVPVLNEHVNTGQQSVGVLDLILRHPGEPRNSQVQLTGLSFEFVDDAGEAVVANEIIYGVRFLRQRTVIGELEIGETDSSLLFARLGSPLTLSPGETDTIRLEVSIRHETDHAGFGLVIDDSTQIMVRDLSSGSALVASSDTSSLIVGEVFPMSTGTAFFKSPSTPPELCMVSSVPSTIVGGTDEVPLIDINLSYQVEDNLSPLRFRAVRLYVSDTLGNYLNPNELFDRIGYQVQGSSISYQEHIKQENGLVLFDLDDGDVVIDPGESMTLRLVADIDAGAQFDHFVLNVQESSGLWFTDATDTTTSLGFIQPSGCDNTYPFVTEASRVLLPSGRPVLIQTSLPVQLAYAAQTGLTLPVGELSYQNPDPQGDIAMRSWGGKILKRTNSGFTQLSPGKVFAAVHLSIDNQIVATDSTYDGDSLKLELDDEYILIHNDYLSVSMSFDLKSYAPEGNYLIEFEDSTFAELVDRNLATAVYIAFSGQGYPFHTAEISLVSSDLGSSFVNYPNPFYPSQGEITTIGFVLREDAYIDIEVFSVTGDLVKTVAENSFRAAGSYQADLWDGYNDDGLRVISGTYFCRITASYTSGGADSYRRKIAVIR